MLTGFRNFVMRGNVIDLAVGVIIGVAFGAVVDSLTKDIINPILAMAVGQPDFSYVKIGSIAIGNFINAVIAFLLKALGLYFLIVLPFSAVAARAAAKAASAAVPPALTLSEELLKEIRDSLRLRA